MSRNLPAKSGEQQFVDDILARALQTKIVTPEDYSMENAVKSAWLQLSQKGLLKKCSQDSILNSVMDMIVQGLNPSKEQGYFIDYGGKLKFMRSYLGSIAVAKRFDKNVAKINYAAIYEGDKFRIDIIKGMRFPKNHEQDFSNIKKENIIGAYAIALDHDGNEIFSDIMTFEDIKISWERSQKKGPGQPIQSNGKLNPNSDHAKQPDRFACRTVVNRLCKMIISVTDDRQLLRSIRKTDEDATTEDLLQVEYEHADDDIELIDFSDDEMQDAEVEEPKKFESATDDQCTKIFDLETKANRQKTLLAHVSSIIGVEIGGLKELSFDDANMLIDMLQSELDESTKGEQKKPDWAE